MQKSSPQILGTKNRNRLKRRRRNLIWEIQWFHLHCRLLHVPGATGYGDLKMVNAIVHNILNQLWIDLIREAVAREMPRQLRQMFAYILVLSNVNLLQIWERFHDNFSEDGTHLGLGRDAAYLRGLGDILSVLRYNGYNLHAFNLKVLLSMVISLSK